MGVLVELGLEQKGESVGVLAQSTDVLGCVIK